MNKLKLAVQLYTLREAVEKDLAGTLRKIRAIGLMGVELAGYGDLKSADLVRKAADAAGVAVVASHVSVDDLKKSFDKVVADQKRLGNRDVVVPWLSDTMRKTAADWVDTANLLNALGHRLDKAGLRLSYHNHAFEFDLYDGQTGMNLLLQHTDPAVVGLEVDVYWVAAGKHDPVQFLQSLGNRLRLVHLKDRAVDGHFAPVGSGALDFPTLCQTAEEAGVAWGVIEQDDCYGQDPFDVIAKGYAYLKSLGYA